jgi:class 3 adenylate cyclase
MTVRCQQCATEMPDNMRFCGACGAPLEPVAPAARERRLVSVLFCDLVGFTTFSERRDHEDVRDTLDEYFSAVRQVVGAYGGTIEKFIGDAVMAVWGAPVAREDDAERAVRAGLAAAAAVAGLADRLVIPELRLRVGILTGEAAVDIGSASEAMVIGDSVNTASRIQSIAAPGQVLVEDITRLATERSIDYEDAGTHAVKGKSTPIHVWRATRVVSRRGGAGRSAPLEPPLVGRDAELAALQACVGRLLAAGAGLELVMVTGEAGLGKSRLAWELQRHVDETQPSVRWLSGRVLAFGEGGGFSALAEIIRAAARIGLQDPPARQRDMIETWLDALLPAASPDLIRAARAVGRLLELEDGTELMEPGALFSAWRTVLEHEASRTPTVVVFEELDRAESALVAFVRHLREWGESAPMLILALGRPGPWLDPLAALGEQIVLAPLSDEHMDDLVTGIVNDASAPLLRSIRTDGGGVPLFAIEALRALAQSEVLAIENGHYVVTGPLGELALAPTIRALIASRLDRLRQIERRSLSGGAVLGEHFPAAGAAALTGIADAEAVDLLDGLVVKAILDFEPALDAPASARDHPCQSWQLSWRATCWLPSRPIRATRIPMTCAGAPPGRSVMRPSGRVRWALWRRRWRCWIARPS